MSNPQAQPKCCGEVVYVTISPTISYHYCRGCKNEISSSTTRSAPNGRKQLDPDDLLIQFEALLKAQEEDNDKLVTMSNGETVLLQAGEDIQAGDIVTQDRATGLIMKAYFALDKKDKKYVDPFKIATRKDVEEDEDLQRLTGCAPADGYSHFGNSYSFTVEYIEEESFPDDDSIDSIRYATYCYDDYRDSFYADQWTKYLQERDERFKQFYAKSVWGDDPSKPPVDTL